MDRDQLVQLERAAVDMMSPPHAVTEESRKHADAIFMELRKSKLPYNTCKFILENSGSDFVLFQAVSTIREASMREWSLLPPPEREDLRCYLLTYLTTHTTLTTYVKAQVLHTIALLVKRGSLEGDREKVFDSIFSVVSQLLATGEHGMNLLGCSLLSALLTEFSSSTGSSNIGLPLDFHIQAKKILESGYLLKVLFLSVQFLQRCSTPDHTHMPHLLSSFLSLTSQVLNWDFKQHIMFRATTLEHTHVILRPPKTYSPTFLDPEFLALFFRLLPVVRSNEDQLHHVVQCLTQMASLTNPVLSTDRERQVYVHHFVSGILLYVSSSSDLSSQEMYGLSCITRRLTVTFSSKHFISLDVGQLTLFVQLLSQLTVLCAQRTAQEQVEEESLVYQESLEHFLEVWVSLIQGSTPPELFTQPLTEIVSAYVQSKLSAPRGWRTLREDTDEIIDTQEDDRVTYSDELSSMGCIARTIPDHSLPLLLRLLSQCTNESLHLCSVVQQQPNLLLSRQTDLDSLHEDLHWLVLIAGYTLCDIAEGEDVLIPTELMQHSISRLQTRHSQGLSCPELGDEFNTAELVTMAIEGGGTDLSDVDPVVALVIAVCRLVAMEKLFISHGLIDVLSPQLCESSVWCLGSITEPYLLFSDESYEQVSVSLSAVFGSSSKNGRWLTELMVDKVVFNLTVWSAEESLALSTVQLLKSVVKSQQRASVAIQCDVLWSLMRSFSSGHEPTSTLPPTVQRDLMCCLVKCGQRKQEFLSELLHPFATRFQNIVHSADFPSQAHDHTVQLSLLSILEALCGLSMSIRANSSREVFEFVLPFLEASTSLAEVYSDDSEMINVILVLFTTVAENFIVFLDQAHSVQLYEVSLALIQTYAKCNTGKYKKAGLAEEEACDDLLLFMKMLSHLTTKDYIDFGGVANTERNVAPVDVVITGIQIILPLMNEEILKFPSLCRQFYSLLHYVCEMYPESVVVLTADMFITCMHLLQAGLTNYGADVSKCSLECIESIADHYNYTPSLHTLTPLTHSLEHFLKVLFEMMLSSSFDMDLIESAGGATYALISSCKEHYSSLAQAIVTSHADDPLTQTKLADAFNQLTPQTLTFDLSKQSKATFRKNLEHFLPHIKGFLCYM